MTILSTYLSWNNILAFSVGTASIVGITYLFKSYNINYPYSNIYKLLKQNSLSRINTIHFYVNSHMEFANNGIKVKTPTRYYYDQCEKTLYILPDDDKLFNDIFNAVLNNMNISKDKFIRCDICELMPFACNSPISFQTYLKTIV
jgi:hypothetical protein